MGTKVLNLYASIGGNRKLRTDVEVTAVEWEQERADYYQKQFPNDIVIVGDAHDYLLKHYKEFDFIRASPPCPTHSRMRMNHKVKVYPDMSLYQEIILLKTFFKGKWIVENVISYYDPLIKPTTTLHRHYIRSNFFIQNREYESVGTCKIPKEREFLQKLLGFNLDNTNIKDKRKALRDCVLPELGLHVFEASKRETGIQPLF